MPIGTGIVYNTGDLILSQVSSSGTAFLETKIAAATSSLIYFDSTARINSASLNSITVGTASYVSGSNSIVTNFTASNISASGTSSFGYVGIGTNSPAYKLDLQNTSSTARLGNAIVGAFPVDGNYALFGHNSLNHSSSATNYALLQESNGSTYLNAIGQPIYFRIANTNKMILNSSGQFGIGTTSPITGYLDVRSNQTKSVAGPTSIAFFGSGDGGNPLGLVLNHESSSGVKMVGLVGTEYGSSGNNIKINETLHVQYTGGVGIGTISPSAKFQVVQTAAVYPMAKFTDTIFAESAYLSAFTNAGGNTLGFSGLECSQTNSTTRRLWIGTDSPYAVPEAFIGTPDNLPLVFYTSGSARMFISSSGNVGIGLTNPAYKLDVNGSINTSTFMFVSYQYGNAFPLQLNASNFLKANDYYYGMTINSGDVNYISGKFLINGGTYKRVELYGYENSIGYIPTVIPGGNVGIGTINPAYLLDVSGSTRHGYRAADNHYFTGSVNISGSLNATASWANNAVSASYATTAQTANALNTGNSYTIAGLTNNGTLSQQGTLSMGSGYQILATTGTAPIPGIAFVGDTNTGIYSPGADTIGFSISGSEKVRINSNGYVGIGTTSPFSGAELDVWGDIVLMNQNWSIRGNNGNGDFAIEELSGSSFSDSNIKFYIASGGNVGIGTIVPTQKLEVHGNGQFGNDNLTNVGLRLTRLNGGMRTSEHTYHSSQNSPWYTYGQNLTWTGELAGIVEPTQVYRPYFEGFAPAAGYKVFGFMDVNTGSFTSANVINALAIKNNGNVGIGTTDPATKLHLSGTGSTELRITSTTSNTNSLLSFYELTLASWGIEAGQANGSFFIKDLYNTRTVLTLNSSGNVGIGTTSPLERITFGSSDSIIARSSDTTFNSGYCSRILFNQGGTGYGYLGFYTYEGGSGGGERMRIAEGGNVGIGTTVPVNKLQVNGNVSGSSFTSSISNAVGFLGTSSWAQNVVSASFATTAQTANALNASNTYTVAGLTSAYVDVNGSGTIPSTGIYRPSSKTLGLSADATLILKINGSVSPYVTSIESGNVGIGSSSPTSKLEVLTSAVSLANQPNIIGNFRGDTDGRSLIRVDNTSTSAGAAALQAGISFVAYSNISNQPSANKHEAQIILGSTGATSVPGGQTGTLQIVAPLDIAFNVSASNTIMTGSSYTTFGSNAMYIARSGNIGIGTTSPATKLDVKGNVFVANAADGNNTIAFGNIGTLGPLNGAPDNLTGSAFLVVSSSTVSGAPSHMKFYTTTGGVCGERMRIDASGNVGIGSASPAYKLDVAGGDVNFATGTILRFGTVAVLNESSNANDIYANIRVIRNLSSVNQDGMYIGYGNSGGTSGHLRFYANNLTERMRIDASNGNVGIGITNPAAKLSVTGSGTGQMLVGDAGFGSGNYTGISVNGTLNTTAYNILSSPTDTNLYINRPSGNDMRFREANSDQMVLLSGGNLGIGTSNPGAKLEISGSSNSALLNIKSPISGAIVYVSGSGAVGINTSNVGAYTLQVNGSFAATTKSFVIDHPTKAGKRLIYGSLESPYHGIRLTGRDTIKDGKCKVELPDYMYKLILHDSINIQLTGIKCNKTLYVDEINIPENYFTIAYDKGVFESYKDYEFFWDFTAIRADVPELNTEL